MNQASSSQRKKNWQWRIIIWTSLFLIFGKTFGNWLYHALAIDQAYTATANVATKVGLRDVLGTNTTTIAVQPQLTIEVINDTASEYTVDSKITFGKLDFEGHSFAAGETKRFTVRPESTGNMFGIGDILFLSSPIAGSYNTTCQEIHTLNYDLKYANQVKQPLVVNLSSIASKMDCKNNATHEN